MMKDLKEALELRDVLKKKKPVFLKQDAHKKAKLKNHWRKPRGRHSKMRLKLKSYRKQPSSGYYSPKLARGLNPQGLKEVNVCNLQDLNEVQKNEVVIIGKTVGLKKKLDILKKIKELKDLVVLNVKDVDKFIKETEEKFLVKKEELKKKDEKKKKSKEESVKKAEERKKEEEKEEEKKTEEDKKEEEESRLKDESRQKSMQQPV